MDAAMGYAQTTPIARESDYPYKSKITGFCNYANNGKTKAGAINVPTANSNDALRSAIAKTAVSVAIQADTAVFQNYTGGVITDPACGTALNHAVTAVGYGVFNGTPYFLIKNSWGGFWGDKGYVKVAD